MSSSQFLEKTQAEKRKISSTRKITFVIKPPNNYFVMNFPQRKTETASERKEEIKWIVTNQKWESEARMIITFIFLYDNRSDKTTHKIMVFSFYEKFGEEGSWGGGEEAKRSPKKMN
jgi:hypothetical protein